MFWKFDLNTTSHVDKLLEGEEVSLQELMEEEDLLQECKAQNRRLVDFVCQQHCMEELVALITQEPPRELDEKVRFKYPNTACELLTSDVPQINDRLGGDEGLLGLLCDFLEAPPPLNPLLASFFSKTIGNLVARKTEQVISFLRKKTHFIPLVLKHMDASAMMDLLLRLISCVEPGAPLRQEVLQWLNEEKLIQRLVALICPNQDEERQSNASQTLCDITRLSRDQSHQRPEAADPDPLLATLESQECVEQLLRNMLDGERVESCIVSGTQVLLALLEPRRASMEGPVDAFSQGLGQTYLANGSVLWGIAPRLYDVHQLLLHPPKAASILTTVGVLEEPLGNARLHGARLVAALLHTNTPSIHQELCRLNTLEVLLDLFFKYTWNNFLHFQVELCIAAILAHTAQESGSAPMLGTEDKNGATTSGNSGVPEEEEEEGPPENIMLTHLFQKCCLVQRILDAWEANDRIQAEGGMRRGHMGHLTRIANSVVQTMEKGPGRTRISQLIKGLLPEDCRGRWESFVEETLAEANRRNTVDLVSTHHHHSPSEGEDTEAAFPSELSLQQAFSEYQVQQMAAAVTFVDQFGFNDEEFAEPEEEERINAPFDRIAEINFCTDAEEGSPKASLFEACCSERIQQFDDNGEEEDIWEEEEEKEKDISYTVQAKSRTRFGLSPTLEDPPRCPLGNGGPASSGDSGKEEAGGPAGGSDSPLPEDRRGPTEAEGPQPPTEGSRWTAVSSKPPTSCVAMDVGSSVWDSATSDVKMPEDRGWATFTDFQPFCCSEAGARCSSPVEEEEEREGSYTEEQQQQNQGQSPAAAGTSSSPPCVWNVCVARKAPLVASDSSSSGGSDSEEDEGESGTGTKTVGPASRLETSQLAVDSQSEKSAFTCSGSRVAGERLTSRLESRPVKAPGSKAGQPEDELPGTTRTATASSITVASEAKQERKEEPLPGTEPLLNGPA